MVRTRCLALAAVLLLPWTLVHPPAQAAASGGTDVITSEEGSGTPSDGRRFRLERIRTADPRMRKLIEAGVRTSPSLRALVERLEQSDVVVYVECTPHLQARVSGRLIFVSAAGGLRYVVVQLVRLPSRAQQIAILAHELQHAVEIADTPAISDGPSLAREYLRMGHVNHRSPPEGVAFDTDAAVEMGRKVMEEVMAVTGD